MKRRFLLLFLPVFLFLNSCSVSDCPDAFLLCSELNEAISKYNIDINDALIDKCADDISYMFFLGEQEHILIRLSSKEKDLRLHQCSLSIMSNKDGLTDSEFLDVAKPLIHVFSQSKDNPDEIIDYLKAENKGSNEPAYYESVFFRYSYQKNKYGSNIIIENKLLSPAPCSDLTLRNEHKKVSP